MNILGQRLRTVQVTNTDQSYQQDNGINDPAHHWDLTDKGLWNQDTAIGSIILENTDIRGWKGEIFYIGGTGPSVITMENSTIATSNGDGFNPGGTGRYELTNCRIGDCYQAIEGLSGSSGSTMVNVELFDSIRAFITGAPGNSAFGYNYAYPNRDSEQDLPWTNLGELTITNVAAVALGSYLRGQIFATDCSIAMEPSAGALTDIDLEIHSVYDRGGQFGVDISTALSLNGPSTLTTQVPSAPVGTWIKPPSNIHIRLSTRRSARAQPMGGNAAFRYPFEAGGYLDANSVSVTIVDSESILPSRGGRMAVTDRMPLIKHDRWRSTIATLAYIDGLTATSTTSTTLLRPYSPIHNLFSSGAGTFACAMATSPAASGDNDPVYADGQRVRLYHAAASNASFTFAATGMGMHLSAARSLTMPGQYLDLVWSEPNQNWIEEAFGDLA